MTRDKQDFSIVDSLQVAVAYKMPKGPWSKLTCAKQSPNSNDHPWWSVSAEEWNSWIDNSSDEEIMAADLAREIMETEAGVTVASCANCEEKGFECKIFGDNMGEGCASCTMFPGEEKCVYCGEDETASEIRDSAMPETPSPLRDSQYTAGDVEGEQNVEDHATRDNEEISAYPPEQDETHTRGSLLLRDDGTGAAGAHPADVPVIDLTGEPQGLAAIEERFTSDIAGYMSHLGKQEIRAAFWEKKSEEQATQVQKAAETVKKMKQQLVEAKGHTARALKQKTKAEEMRKQAEEKRLQHGLERRRLQEENVALATFKKRALEKKRELNDQIEQLNKKLRYSDEMEIEMQTALSKWGKRHGDGG